LVETRLIEGIEVINGSVPLTKTDPVQQWVDEWSVQLYVKVRAGALEGWGQVLPAGGSTREPYAALINRLSQALIGLNETSIEDAWNLMRRLTFSGGYGITTGAISGIDIALWDIKGKESGHSLASILGGMEAPVKRYASLSRYNSLERAVEATGWVLGKGYSMIKIHQTSKDTLETFKTIRKKYGYGFDLAADLNCAFSLEQGKKFMEEIVRYEPLWVEEPIWPPDDFDSLRKLNRIGPIAAGENTFSFFEFKRLMEMEALSYYQPDVAKVGGVTPTLEILNLAKKYKAKIAFHNRPDNGWISTIASTHVASAIYPDALIETPPNEIPSEYFLFRGKITKSDITPSGPGLGISPLPTIPTSNESKMLRFHEN
jgi:L-alanine-DL-glutamate epimerase-like enolase superfamily enzyme